MPGTVACNQCFTDNVCTRLTDKELMRLFGPTTEDSTGRPFILVDNPDPRGGFFADRDHEGFADEM